MANKKVSIKYTSRDFNTIKADLVEYARRYYPDTFKDFNEAGFGSLTLDTVSYVGDILSFYLDYQANESFLDTCLEFNNIIKHGKYLGYKYRGSPSSFGTVSLYLIVPSNPVGLGPDTRYIPVLQRGSAFSSNGNNNFVLIEPVHFSDQNNEVVVAQVDDTSGVPLSYAIKSYGQVISGELMEELKEVGDYERFMRVELNGRNVSEIVSVTDSEGHEYFEVDYLSQNVIYKAITNYNTDKTVAPYVMKPIVVPRRFVVEQERNTTFLQFGYGTEEEILDSSVVDPSSVVLNLHGKTYVTDDSFDPSNLMKSDKFGVVPSNTTLRIITRNNTSENTNAAANTVREAVDPLFEFENVVELDSSKISTIATSLEVTNEDAIVGDVTFPTSEELKRRILDSFSTQNRAVTISDYKSYVYRMPVQFGAIKRCNIIQDKDSMKRNMNMYVISEDKSGILTATVPTIKNNLKTWIEKNKMINDTIDILDARIINFGIEFEVIADQEKNQFFTLSTATNKVASLFSNALDIGEPISITNIFLALKYIEDIVDVVSAKIVKKSGGAYSDIKFNIDEFMSADGRYVSCPVNCIFELKFPGVDIKGTIR